MFTPQPFILSSLYKIVPNPVAYFCAPNFCVFDNFVCVKTLINKKTLQNNQDLFPELKEKENGFVGVLKDYYYVYINNEIVMVINEFYYCNSFYTHLKPDILQGWDVSKDAMQVLKDFYKNIDCTKYDEYENVSCE